MADLKCVDCGKIAIVHSWVEDLGADVDYTEVIYRCKPCYEIWFQQFCKLPDIKSEDGLAF